MPKNMPTPNPVLLLDEAVHLLRRLPLSLLLTYYIGTIPFVLGVLYFLTDMISSAYAWLYAGTAALLIAGLYVWMKTWQARFCALLLARLSGASPGTWSVRGFLCTSARLIMLQALGLCLLPLGPLAFVLMIPSLLFVVSVFFAFIGVPAFLYVILILPLGLAFSLSALTCSAMPEVPWRTALSRSLRQSLVWPGQNLLLGMILGAGSFLVALLFWQLIALVPMLLKMLLGVETPMSRAGVYGALSSSMLTVCLGLTYLLLDPLVKAVYVLRVFYSESRFSGADLLAQLNVSQSAKRGTLLVLASLLFPIALAARAEEPVIHSERLNESIEQTLRQRKYSWRMPREKLADQLAAEERLRDAGLLKRFADAVDEAVDAFGQWVSDVIKGFIDWLENLLPTPERNVSTPSTAPAGGDLLSRLGRLIVSLIPLLKSILIATLIVAFVIAAYKIYKFWLRRERLAGAGRSGPAARPDLANEEVSADELPEDEWLQLAAEQMEAGDLRLAIRALYLGSLAFLAEQRLIQIRKYKSNWDYVLELRRRRHAMPEVIDAFFENTSVYDCIWYGMHEVHPAMIQGFRSNIERIRDRAPAN